MARPATSLPLARPLPLARHVGRSDPFFQDPGIDEDGNIRGFCDATMFNVLVPFGLVLLRNKDCIKIIDAEELCDVHICFHRVTWFHLHCSGHG
uniref:Uncharacterized protein n=1 Tax=Oryza brachyantha TaxID=4533 RepID=J3N495_ORYBR